MLAAVALLLGLFMLLHASIPNRVGNLGSLVETFLPWFGLLIPVLLAGALLRRSVLAVVALLLPAVVWLNLFGGLLTDKSHPGGGLTVVSHNVGADNPDTVGTARALTASGADVLALEELDPGALGTYEKELAAAYPHHTVLGTVGVWSKLPLSDTRTVDVKMDAGPLGDAKPADVKLEYNRGLRTTVATDHGPLAVYVARLGAVPVNPRAGLSSGQRIHTGAQALGRAVAAERNERVVLLGDLNGTVDDRAYKGVTSRMRSAQEEGRRRVRLQLARHVPGGADRPDPGPGRGAGELVGTARDRQRPPPGRGPHQLVKSAEGSAPVRSPSAPHRAGATGPSASCCRSPSAGGG